MSKATPIVPGRPGVGGGAPIVPIYPPGSGIVGPPLSISVADAVVVGESTILQLSLRITIAEPVTLTDSPLLIVTPLKLSTSDSTTVSESTALLLITPGTVNRIDTVSVTDNPTLYITTLMITASDSTTVSESISFGLVSPIALSLTESIQLTDSPMLAIQAPDIPPGPVITTERGAILCFCAKAIEVTTVTAFPFAATIIPRCLLAEVDVNVEIVIANLSANCLGPTFNTPLPPIVGAPGAWQIRIEETITVGESIAFPETVLFSGETYQEAFDLGLSGQTGAATYMRSMFYIPPDVTGFGFEEANTVRYIELVGVNGDAVDRVVTVYSVTDQLTPTLADPQTITIPATVSGRVRSAVPFVHSSVTGLYLVQTPLSTGASSTIVYRLRVAAVQSGVSKTTSEIRLSNSSSATALDQTIGGGDLSRSTSFGLDSDNLGFVSFGGPRWKYNASDWDTISSITLVGVLANASFDIATRYSELALWDVTLGSMTAKVQCASTNMFLNPQLFTTAIPPSLLVDGHVYEARYRSVKTLIGFNDFNTYFHKARLLITVGPVRSIELFARCGNAAGVSETRSLNPYATFNPVPSIHFEINSDAVGTYSVLSGYDTSDTSGANSGVADSEVEVPNTAALTARSGNIVGGMVDQHRYAVSGVLQGSLVYKIPAAGASGPNNMASRAAWLTVLSGAGYTATKAVLFTEGTGTPTEFYGGSLTETGSPVWVDSVVFGQSKSAAITDNWSLGASNAFLSTAKGTFFIIRKKVDLTHRASSIFGVNVGTNNTRAGMHAPYSDGIVYGDFGGITAPNRGTFGWTDSAAIEAFVLKGGPSGLQLWLEGTQKFSSATAITLTGNAAAFLINGGAGINGDIAQYYFFAYVPDEVSDALCAQFTTGKVLQGL